MEEWKEASLGEVLGHLSETSCSFIQKALPQCIFDFGRFNRTLFQDTFEDIDTGVDGTCMKNVVCLFLHSAHGLTPVTLLFIYAEQHINSTFIKRKKKAVFIKCHDVVMTLSFKSGHIHLFYYNKSKLFVNVYKLSLCQRTLAFWVGSELFFLSCASLSRPSACPLHWVNLVNRRCH